MIRVLIVEDEPPIARAVKQMIETYSDAFEIIGCEINGHTALLRMEEEEIDVVITDIRMPVMDGLTFLEQAIVLNPNCLAVVLSGHQDFSYAQSALRLGAFDYLLKPLSPDKLRQLLTRLEDAFAKNTLEANRGKWDIGSFHDPVLTKQTSCWVILANIGNWPLLPDDSLVPGANYWKTSNPQKIIRTYLRKNEDVLVMAGKVSAQRVFVIKNSSVSRITQLLADLYSELTSSTELPVTLYASLDPVDFQNTGHLLRNLYSELYNKIKLCRSEVFIRSDNPDESDTVFDRLPLNKLVGALSVNNEKLIKEVLSNTLEIAVENGICQQEFSRFLDGVINDQRLISRNTSNLKIELNEALSNALNPESLQDDLLSILSQYNPPQNSTDKKALITRIERYLIDNYTQSISNELLSELFGFVPSYISKIFRLQTGLSPSEYLTKLRIEKAKELLDSKTDLLIREVAALVGYNDPYYFSKAFKKITGLWPTQYQDNMPDV